MSVERSRTAKLTTNAAFSVLSWLAPILIGLLTTPILVHRLGTEGYGLYALIIGFISYSFSLGVGKIAAKYVAEFRANGEEEKIAPMITATLLITFAVGIVATLVLGVGARYIVTYGLRVPEPDVEIAVRSLYLACVISIAAMFGQIYQFVLQGLQQFGALLTFINLNGILLGVGNIVVVLAGGGVVELLAWNFIEALIIGIAFFIKARTELPHISVDFGISREMARSIFAYASSMIFYQILANILFIFERTYVMRRFGAEALAYYTVPMTLAIYLHSFVGSFAVVLFPVVNELLLDPAKQSELYQKATKIVLAIVVFGVTSLAVLGRAALTLWLGADFAANSYMLLTIHAIVFGMTAMLLIVWQIAEGFHHAKINAATTSVWLIVGIPLMYLAAGSFGTEGIAGGRLIATAITLPVIFYIEKRFLGRVFARFWAAVISKAAVAALCAGVVEFFLVRNHPASLVRLAAAGCAGLLVYCGVLWFSRYVSAAETALVTRLFQDRFGAHVRPSSVE